MCAYGAAHIVWALLSNHLANGRVTGAILAKLIQASRFLTLRAIFAAHHVMRLSLVGIFIYAAVVAGRGSGVGVVSDRPEARTCGTP